MSWLSSAVRKITGVSLSSALPIAASVALPGIGGVAAGAAIKGASMLGKSASLAKKVLPGVGMVAGGEILASQIMNGGNGYAPTKRRRAKGFSARDVRQAKRLNKMLKDFSKTTPTRRAASRSCGCK